MEIYYFAAARAARGVAVEKLENNCATLGEVLSYLSDAHQSTTQAGLPLSAVLTRCSFLVDGHAASNITPVTNASRIDVLPPFAGG